MDRYYHYTQFLHPTLEDARTASQQIVSRCFVEFLDQEGSKPHMAFKLDFYRPFTVPALHGRLETIYGCRLGMDYYPEPPYENGGAILVKLLRFSASTLSTFATFEFSLPVMQTLRFWIEVLSPLAEFEFRQVDYLGNMDGCRDWITQAMITLHRQRMVSWHWVSQNLPRSAIPGEEFRIPGLEEAYQDRSFDVLIRYKFLGVRPRNVWAEYFPICRGIFRNYNRVTRYLGRPLPY